MPDNFLDVRDEQGHLLFRVSRDRSIIQVKKGRSCDQLYEVDLSAPQPTVRRAGVAIRRQPIVNVYDIIGIDNK